MSAAAGNGLLAAALDYSARGWYVFPCHVDKTPATMHGVKDATIDPMQIRRWWTARPDASIGVACGPSGLEVIDLDAKYGGPAAWDKLKAAHNIDDATWTSITGGGGRHIVYRTPDGFHGRNSVGKLGRGVDVRSNGGYFIVPPSRHPSGNTYRWEPSHLDRDPILLPDSLPRCWNAGHLRSGHSPMPAPARSHLRMLTPLEVYLRALTPLEVYLRTLAPLGVRFR